MSPSGHFALGLLSKKYVPKVNVWLLLLASFLIDVVFFISDAFGGEVDGQWSYSHSLVSALTLSLLVYFSLLLIVKNRHISLVLALVVMSHWILDFIVWNNLSFLPTGNQVLGLGFYSKLGVDPDNVVLNKPTLIATAIELTMLFIGFSIYLRNRNKA